MAANEIRVWAVIDANGNALYSSNDRDAVIAEYEERVGRDARLRRVLRIEERTLQFHPRGEPPPDPGEPQTVCVLPWLPLDERVAMGPIVFDQWSEVRELVEEPARTSADRLLSNFFDVRGTPIDPAICFYTSRSPTARMSSDEVSFVRTHCLLLTLAGIAENAYMHQAFEPLNATHGERIFMNFEASAGQVRLVRRRREGWGQSPWRSAGLKSHKPIAAEGRPTAAGEHPGMTLYRQQLVDSLATCVGSHDPISIAIVQSVVPFLRANEMDEYGTPDEDIVWLATALEQLTGLASGRETGRRGSELHIVVSDLFAEHWTTEQRRLCRRWLTDLRGRRNALHGNPATAERWQPWAHGILATDIYVLAVKVLLARANRYILDSWDLTKIEGFSARIALVEGRGPFDEQTLSEAWHQALVSAAKTRLARNAADTVQAP